MKKLMMMLGAVALAAGVQAASFNWQTSTKAFSIAADTIAAGLANGNYGVGSSNADTMKNQIDSYSATWFYALTTDNGTTTETFTGSLVGDSFSSRKINIDLSSDLVTPGADVNYSIVLTGSLTDGKGKEFDLTSNTITGTFEANTIGDIQFESAGATSWTASAAAVPEPTSGLLMLVGLAGLALRRRRA